MTALIVSWNVDSAKPDTLTGPVENVNFLQDVLQSIEPPDIIAFGMQELIDLESRRMAAKTVLLGGKNKTADGSISQKVTTSYKKWYDRLVLAVRLAMPADEPYTVIHTENLVGLFTCIFVKNAERVALKHVALTTVKRGMGGRYGNKVCSPLVRTGQDADIGVQRRAQSSLGSSWMILRSASSTAISPLGNTTSASGTPTLLLSWRTTLCFLMQGLKRRRWPTSMGAMGLWSWTMSLSSWVISFTLQMRPFH